jgi:Pyruvate/2-oxoacid:ferredoxin oxidoreductase delta subunit
LEQSNNFSERLSQLSKVPEPVLGCIRTQEHSNANITCLGGLSEEHLIAIHALQVQQVQLDLTTCSGCSNENGIKLLRERLVSLERKSALPLGRKIRLVEKTAELNFHKETVGRRGFFKALTGALLKETSALLVPAKLTPENSAPYTEKQLPQRGKILNQALEGMPVEEQKRIKLLFRFEIERSEGCDSCAACTKVCPTGAMTEKTDGESTLLEHDSLRCTGCGLCVEFCLNAALQLRDTHPITSS